MNLAKLGVLQPTTTFLSKTMTLDLKFAIVVIEQIERFIFGFVGLKLTCNSEIDFLGVTFTSVGIYKLISVCIKITTPLRFFIGPYIFLHSWMFHMENLSINWKAWGVLIVHGKFIKWSHWLILVPTFSLTISLNLKVSTSTWVWPLKYDHVPEQGHLI